MKLSVLIKTYNEGPKIGRCLDSVLTATAGIAGGVEIIVADSLSSDETVAVAATFPAKIVQLTNACDRGCGSGVQLGYQYARGEFVYVLDGDMEVQPAFVAQALAKLESEPQIAGIAGLVEDNEVRNYFDRDRVKNKRYVVADDVNWLAGGGIYRRKAIQDVGGYAANRNLKGFEEAELGMRLRNGGWRLTRLPIVSVRHTGHAASTFEMIGRAWRSERATAGGVLLKLAFGQPWFRGCLRMFLHLFGTMLYWIVGLVVTVVVPAYLPGWILVGVLGFLILSVRKASLVDAAWSVLLWHIGAVGLLKGILATPITAPSVPLPNVVLYDRSMNQR
jgi:glycosyltransferase involved in cell wall biosynthesis